MKLRTQLLLASTLTLALPVLAYRAVHQLDAALRQSRVHDQLQRVQSATALLTVSGQLTGINRFTASQENLSSDSEVKQLSVLYAERFDHRIFLDGYADDWVGLHQSAREFVFAAGTKRSPDDFHGPPAELSHSKTLPENISSSLVSEDTLTQESTSETGVVAQSNSSKAGVKLRIAASENHIFLFIEVADDNIVFHDPSRGLVATGDHIDVRWQPHASGSNDSTVVERRFFSPVAAGNLLSTRYGRRFEGLQPVLVDNSARGAMAVVNNGYQMELRLPRPENNGHFSIAVIDRDQADATLDPGGEYGVGSSAYRWAGSSDPGMPLNSGNYIGYPLRKLENTVYDVVPAGSRVRLFDSDGRLRADVNRLYETDVANGLIDPLQSNFFNALLFRFFEWIIQKQRVVSSDPYTPSKPFQLELQSLNEQKNTGDPLTYLTYARDHVIGTLSQIGDIEDSSVWLLFETNEDRTNAFTSSAMVRVFSLVTAFSMLVAACLLLFASWLSLRIRSLSNQTRQVVNTEGRFIADVKGTRYRDEIGDLSRDFASLVDRSRGYTQYLESLSAKLSHELRTPLSVVQTSLENIDADDLRSDNRVLVDRAQSGSAQLSSLLRSMSEAARLEQSIASAQFREHDLQLWMTSLQGVYQDLFNSQRITVHCEPELGLLRVVPELLQQALDKLITNASDFSPASSDINIVLEKFGKGFRLSVENDGSSLHEDVLDTLFEPMISQRQHERNNGSADKMDAPHLGLGLYIVRLVAECHRGWPFAENTKNGVRIGFIFFSEPTE